MRKVYLKSLRGTQLLIALFVTAVLLFTIVLTGCSIDDENETSADNFQIEGSWSLKSRTAGFSEPRTFFPDDVICVFNSNGILIINVKDTSDATVFLSKGYHSFSFNLISAAK